MPLAHRRCSAGRACAGQSTQQFRLGFFDDIIEAIVYAADLDADVINMSIGATLPKNGWCDVDGCVGTDEVAALLNAINRAYHLCFPAGHHRDYICG